MGHFSLFFPVIKSHSRFELTINSHLDNVKVSANFNGKTVLNNYKQMPVIVRFILLTTRQFFVISSFDFQSTMLAERTGDGEISSFRTRDYGRGAYSDVLSPQLETDCGPASTTTSQNISSMNASYALGKQP